MKNLDLRSPFLEAGPWLSLVLPPLAAFFFTVVLSPLELLAWTGLGAAVIAAAGRAWKKQWREKDILIAAVMTAYLFPWLRPFALILAALEIGRATIKTFPWAGERPLQTYATFTVFSFLFLAFFTLVTYGCGDWMQGELYGDFFDEVARNFLQGRLDVDPELLQGEAFLNNGKTYTCFGFFPAVLRMLPNYVFPQLYGLWSRVSCLAAFVLIMGALSLLLRANLSKNMMLAEGEREVRHHIWLAVLCLGSPLFYLMSCGTIYHEAILWGLAFSLVGMCAIFRLSECAAEEAPKALWWLSAAAAAAFQTKPTFALPLLLAYGFFWLRFISKRNYKSLLLTSLPLLAVMAFQGWYDLQRFGSAFTMYPLDRHPRYIHIKPEDIPQLFDFTRIPKVFLLYFLPSAANITRTFPFFASSPGLSFDKNYDYVEWVVPLTLTSPFLIAGAFFGLVRLFRGPKNPGLRFGLAAFLSQSLLIMSFYFQTHRTAGELLPALVFLCAFALRGPQMPDPKRARRLHGVAWGLIVLSIAATVLSTAYVNAYRNWGYPVEHQQKLQLALSWINNHISR